MHVKILNEKFVKEHVRAAHAYYEKYKLDPNFSVIAIDYVIRYIKVIMPAIPRDTEVLYAAAYFIALKHPFSYPNYHTKESHARKFGIKVSSLSWYVQRILEDINFIRLHDDQARPYYIDSNSLISAVLHSITSASLHEHLIKTIVNETLPDVFEVQEKVISTLIENLRIIPEVFRRELQFYVHDLIKDQITAFNG